MQAGGLETHTTTSSSAAIYNLITLFKPRQVLLNSINSLTMKHQQLKSPSFSLTDHQRVLLFQSICQFLQLNGFSKSLKKFTKEAHIEKESWKGCLLNLEEICYQFLKTSFDTKNNGSSNKEQVTSQKDGGINHVESVETIKKTKKTEGDEGMKSQEKLEDSPIVDVKPKKKKKSKSASESSEQIVEENHTKPSNELEDASLSVPSEPEKKSKDKKKKRKEESQEEKEKEKETAGEISEQADVSQDKKKEKSRSKKKKEDDLKIDDSSVEDAEINNAKEGSKKRKKSSSEENENGDVEKELLVDSKRRKTDNFDQLNEIIASKTPIATSNGILENDEIKVSQKEKSKLQNGSAESRSAQNAFRRVKEEEVEFVDERLQDNSYWAKDGADIGYGAKAQEVLGQVRGRGFRHEKTKKKRGSYRGGQIDLQSHSIKFNYDDDDE